MTDPPQFMDSSTKRVVMNKTSFLRNLLCNEDSDGECQYLRSVKLDLNLICTGIECDINTVHVIQVAIAALFEYIHLKCR